MGQGGTWLWHADGARAALDGSMLEAGTQHPVSQVTGQVSSFPPPWHSWHRRAGDKPCCREPGTFLDSSARGARGSPWHPPCLAYSYENPAVGMAARMLSSTGAASPPCLHGHTIGGPAPGAGSPGGALFWSGARRAGIPPRGPGTRTPFLTSCPSGSSDGIPREGRHPLGGTDGMPARPAP